MFVLFKRINDFNMFCLELQQGGLTESVNGKIVYFPASNAVLGWLEILHTTFE